MPSPLSPQSGENACSISQSLSLPVCTAIWDGFPCLFILARTWYHPPCCAPFLTALAHLISYFISVTWRPERSDPASYVAVQGCRSRTKHVPIELMVHLVGLWPFSFSFGRVQFSCGFGRVMDLPNPSGPYQMRGGARARCFGRVPVQFR